MKKIMCLMAAAFLLIACNESKQKPVSDETVTDGDGIAVGDGDEPIGDGLLPDGDELVGDELLPDTDELLPPGCGNGVIEEGETCDGPAECAEIDPERYISGTAECIENCTRYNTTYCIRSCEDGQLRCNANVIEECYGNEWSAIEDCSDGDLKCFSSMGNTECRALGESSASNEIYQCYRTCDWDETCIAECIAAGGPNSQALFAPLQECIEENCEDVPMTQLGQCVNVFCRPLYQACRNDEGIVCGNGVTEPGEECDDGNISAGDGCAADCTSETPGVCGNGILESPEKCDDGNDAAGDGCAPDCLIEYGERFDFAGPDYEGDIVMAINISPNGDTQSATGTLPALFLRRVATPATSATGLNLFIDPHFGVPEGVTSAALFEPTLLLAPAVGDTQPFYVAGDSGYTQVAATLVKLGEHVQIWLADAESDWATEQELTDIASEFDTVIYPIVTTNFYEPSDVNQDGTITLLFTDLGETMAGYFSPGDLYAKSRYPQSNERDMIFVSTRNSLDKAGAYAVITHEFQHLVNNNRNVLLEGDMQGANDMGNLWINEGLSMAAMHLYNGAQNEWLVVYNSLATIAEGQSLTYWEYNDNVRVYGNYALAYLFFQYLYAQGGKEALMFREIIESANNNYLCVEEAIKKHVAPGLTMSDFTVNWRIALLLNEATGPFGFAGEEFTLEPRLYTGTGTTLRGTGAIFREVSATFTEPSDKGPLTRYVGITTK